MYRQRTAKNVTANDQYQTANPQLIASHDHRIDRLRETFAIQCGRRKNKRRQHHGAFSRQIKAEIQAVADVHHHDARKAQNTAERFVVAQSVVLINKVRQQYAEECACRVHD